MIIVTSEWQLFPGAPTFDRRMDRLLMHIYGDACNIIPRLLLLSPCLSREYYSFPMSHHQLHFMTL
jgi:hypothetical protein